MQVISQKDWQIDKTQHLSVFAHELVDVLNVHENGIYVDATLGGGGHLIALLTKLQQGKVIGIDLDTSAIQRVITQLKADGYEQKSEELFTRGGKEVFLINDNFRNLQQILRSLKIEKIDGLMADLGFSSDQLSELAGLSFEQDDAVLDMRFDQHMPNTAAHILNNASLDDLHTIFIKYADLPISLAYKLSQAIVLRRGFDKVSDLNSVIASLDNHNLRSLSARIYQSLRIAVNDEYVALQTLLTDAFESLSRDGRLAIITFHSGEEKIVSEFCRHQISGHKADAVYNYLRPSVRELRLNLRARSAKLFALKKN